MINQVYELWCEKATEDADVAAELVEMARHTEKIEEAFFRDLSFGTGGLRGVIGAGTNRMNIYTVAKASQGLAAYVCRQYNAEDRKIAISYDSRIKSDVFAKVAAEVFAANGIQVYIYAQLMPTPCLSFAVRELDCAAGIMITASHNASKYNGYKVYGADGCQITTKSADEILKEIKGIDLFSDVKRLNFEKGMANGLISIIPERIYTDFVDAVKKQTMLTAAVQVDRDVAIVYSPLNGTGLKPVLRVLKENGYSHITVVKEQEQPDGLFPTCPYPNPETKEAMALGMAYAKKYHADLMLATDPDCDRVGAAVRAKHGEYVLLSGNEMGILLFDYICSRRIINGTMPENPVMVKSIVTTDLAEHVAAHYGVATVNVLTGFKYIGEQIGLLERQGKKDSYIFGFEESYGYLSGPYVRDKDAVGACFLICEMFVYYRDKGISFLDKLNELYQRYGFWMNELCSFSFEGISGFNKMQKIMDAFRTEPETIGSKKILKCINYLQEQDGLPKADVLKFTLEGGCTILIRPSGTEPKIKVYLSVTGSTKEEAMAVNANIREGIQMLMMPFLNS